LEYTAGPLIIALFNINMLLPMYPVPMKAAPPSVSFALLLVNLEEIIEMPPP
jgi:hypothetical protein